MDDSPFNSSYFWSPVPTVQGQVETNLLLELSWNTHGIVYVLCQKIPRRDHAFGCQWPYVKPYMSVDSDLTLFILLLTLSDNARLTSHRSSVNVSADVCESLSDNIISVLPLQPLCSLVWLTFCISHLTSFFFDFLLPSSHDIHPTALTLWLLLPTTNFVSYILCFFFFCFGHSSLLFSMVLTYLFLISILQSGDTSFSLPHLILPYHLFEMSPLPLCFVTSPFSFPSSYHQTSPLLIIM